MKVLVITRRLLKRDGIDVVSSVIKIPKELFNEDQWVREKVNQHKNELVSQLPEFNNASFRPSIWEVE